MKIYLRAFLIFTFGLFPCVTSAYELVTHGAMTQAAFENSVLNDITFRAYIGIPEGQNPFGESYYDVSGNVVSQRTASTFEGKIIKQDLGADPLSHVGWLMRGAIREDDLGYWDPLGLIPAGDDPHDDPYGPIWRVFNHFYDPINNAPLTVLGVPAGLPAPGWGIGTQDILTQPVQADANRRNHFTVFDAREAMYRALTGKNVEGSLVAATQTERNKYWATTFRALGDVVHLLQDMSQPQHTHAISPTA